MNTSIETSKNPTPKWEQTFQKWSSDDRLKTPLQDFGVQVSTPNIREAIVFLVESDRKDSTSREYRKRNQLLQKATGKSPEILNNLLDNVRAIIESQWQKPPVVEFER